MHGGLRTGAAKAAFEPACRPGGVTRATVRTALAWLALAAMAPSAGASELSVEVQRLLQARAPTGVDTARLERLYTARAGEPLWCAARGPTRAAHIVRARLLDAVQDGLDPADYHAPEIARLWPGTTARDLAHLDVLLSDALLHFAHDLANGRDAMRDADPGWHIARDPVDTDRLLVDAVRRGTVEATLAGLAPPHARYARLREALGRYLSLARSGGWHTIAGGPWLDAGARSPRVADVRDRLRAEDSPAVGADGDPQFFDAALDTAVRAFQRRHGLEDDGIVGPRTLAALNVPAPERARQLALNLERWRWMPRTLPARRVEVNVPGFTLTMFDGVGQATTMRVIVGNRDWPTPRFAGRITDVVINPYWYVPTRIARLEVVPAQKADPGYLAAQHIRVLRESGGATTVIPPRAIDWARVDPATFDMRLRQDAGEGNSLGRLKFVVSNPFEVFLHDTPGRHLFEQTNRALSHGCVRLERPLDLAAFAFAGDPEWDARAVAAAIDSGRTRQVRLPTPVPVYVAYWTAWVDDDGTVQFRDDVYATEDRTGGCGDEESPPRGQSGDPFAMRRQNG